MSIEVSTPTPVVDPTIQPDLSSGINDTRPNAETEATLAVFAKVELKAQDKDKVFEHLGSIGLHLDGIVVSDIKLPGFTEDDYGYFESQKSPEEQEMVEYRTTLLQSYEPFADQIARIKEELKAKPAIDIKGYIAAGNESEVFKVVDGQGVEYAARISRYADKKGDHIDSYPEGTLRGRGIDGLEQLVALSYTESVTIGELLKGKGLEKYTTAEIAAIPDEHFLMLADTLLDSVAAGGISVDGNDGNVLYDPEHGFSIVDYHSSSYAGNKVAYTLSSSIFKTHYWLGPSKELPSSEFKEDYETLGQVVEDILPAYERWLNILNDRRVERGFDEDALQTYRMAEDITALKLVQEQLRDTAEIEMLISQAHRERQDSIVRFRNRLSHEDNEAVFLRTNLEEKIARLEKGPARLFQPSTLKPSRNDNR